MSDGVIETLAVLAVIAFAIHTVSHHSTVRMLTRNARAVFEDKPIERAADDEKRLLSHRSVR